MKNKLLKIKTKNFKGLGDFEYEIESNDGLTFIYGDNGVGKTSIIKIFDFLAIMMENLRLKEDIASKSYVNPFTGKPNVAFPIGLSNPYGTYAMWEGNEVIKIELWIELNEKPYKYRIELNEKNEIEFEEFYSLTKTLEKKKVFFAKDLYNKVEIDKGVKKHFGVNEIELNENSINSFISYLTINRQRIIGIENQLENDDNNIHPIDLLIFSFTLLNVANPENSIEQHFQRAMTILPLGVYNNSDNISIERFTEEAEKFEEFVMSIDKKIRGVKVVKQALQGAPLNTNPKVILSLQFRIKVDGKAIWLPYELLSTGTQDYIKYFRIIMIASSKDAGLASKSIILFDEFGIHLHPSITINLVNYFDKICKENNVQMFSTTHQALLLDKKYCGLKNNQKVILTKDAFGKTKIKSLKGIIGNKDNYLDKFLKGIFGGNDLNPILSDEDE